MNILWLYGSVTKWDAINHWYHLDFARILAKQLNINLMVYGYKMHKLHPDIAKIQFDVKKTGLDIKKDFDFDVVIMDNKARFVYTRTAAESRARKPRRFWLNPEFLNGLDNTPKVFLEGDYHQQMAMENRFPDEKKWYEKRKIDLLLVRHLNNLIYSKESSVPLVWFPCSVDINIFKPNLKIERVNKVCLIRGYGKVYYIYRHLMGDILKPTKLIKTYNDRLLGQDYINCLQSYVSHISGSSIKFITAAKMFEIMACGSVLLTDEGNEYGLKELFPNNSYCTYKRDGSDIISKAQKIINEPEYRKYITTNAAKCIANKHSHKIRAKELINIITKKFGISYKENTDSAWFGQISRIFTADFFKKPKEEIKEIIDIESKEIEKVKENEVKDIKLTQICEDTKKISLDNEKLLKKLHSKNIQICVLNNTCYEIIVNNKLSGELHIAIDKPKLAKTVLGTDFNFGTKPQNTRKFLYKGMVLNVPYKVLSYLHKQYGDIITKELKKKKKRLRLINNYYKFIQRK